jgi:hypothetical protein
MGLGCASPAGFVFLKMGYPRGFVLEEFLAIWASFEETCVWLKIF